MEEIQNAKDHLDSLIINENNSTNNNMTKETLVTIPSLTEAVSAYKPLLKIEELKDPKIV